MWKANKKSISKNRAISKSSQTSRAGGEKGVVTFYERSDDAKEP